MRRVASLPKLRVAWTKLNKRNKQSSGVDGVRMSTFEANSEQYLKKIAQQIATQTYNFQGSKAVPLPKPDGGSRILKIATISDRVVGKALALYLQPKLKRFDKPCSFAYQKDKSTHKAVARIHELADAGAKWVVEADIKKFFDKVDRQILITKLSKIVRSPSLLAFIVKALTSEIENKHQINPDLIDLLPTADAGIPQGNTLSPLLANFYMHNFDSAMLRRHYGLVRYADDFVIMCKTEKEAKEALAFAEEFLKNYLGLELHELSQKGKTTIRRYSDGFEFLGFFIRDKKLMPCKNSKEKFKARIKEILSLEKSETLVRKIQRLNNVSRGWHEAFKAAALEEFPQQADDLLYTELSRFLKEKRIFRTGDKLSWGQLKFLGIKSLKDRIRESASTATKSSSAHKGRGPRRKIPKVEPTEPKLRNPVAQQP
jgi:RNA-directed DNA polymerase